MIDFKDFLDNAAVGIRRDLFIVARRASIPAAMQELMDAAHERGLDATMRRTGDVVVVGDLSSARFVVAHAHMAQQLAGMQFTALHGIEHISEDMENTHHVLSLLQAQVRI